jgi:hypothetical protein
LEQWTKHDLAHILKPRAQGLLKKWEIGTTKSSRKKPGFRIQKSEKEFKTLKTKSEHLANMDDTNCSTTYLKFGGIGTSSYK